MENNIEAFRDHFNDVIERIHKYAIFVRGREFQEESIHTAEKLLRECIEGKNGAIEEQREDEANAFLAFELMARAVIEEFRFCLALKDDDPDAAWNHLINCQTSSALAMKSHVVASHLDKYIERLYALERLLFPQPVFFSSAFIVKKSECSICGAEYGECDHIKGRPYMGQLCGRIAKEVDIREVSVVSEPADKHCRSISYTEDGVTRNVFTQRVTGKIEIVGSEE
jgi:hypothetical protein